MQNHAKSILPVKRMEQHRALPRKGAVAETFDATADAICTCASHQKNVPAAVLTNKKTSDRPFCDDRL